MVARIKSVGIGAGAKVDFENRKKRQLEGTKTARLNTRTLDIDNLKVNPRIEGTKDFVKTKGGETISRDLAEQLGRDVRGIKTKQPTQEIDPVFAPPTEQQQDSKTAGDLETLNPLNRFFPAVGISGVGTAEAQQEDPRGEAQRTLVETAAGLVLGPSLTAITGTGAFTATQAAAGKGAPAVTTAAAGKAASGATNIATNSVNAAKSTTWLSKILANTQTVTRFNPETGVTTTSIVTTSGSLINAKTVVGAIGAAIGSYPFAGFFKQEALQQLGFASTAAKKANDLKGEERGLELEKEILNPATWRQIIDGVPYANVMASLDDFFKAAVIHYTIRVKDFIKRKGKQQEKEIKDQQIAAAESGELFTGG